MLIESEKDLERKLAEDVVGLGGWTIKLLPFLVSGLPDRLCLFPGGIVAFAEIKTTGKALRPRQRLIIKKIRAIGFKVVVLDTSAGIDEFIEQYKLIL